MSSDSYDLSVRTWFFRDVSLDDERREQLDFHIKTGDYFPVLATILGFLEDAIKECDCSINPELTPIRENVITNVRKDLAYLHENYRIVPNLEAE